VPWLAATVSGAKTAAATLRHRGIGHLRRRVVLAEAVAELSHKALTADQPDELLRESLQIALDVVGVEYGTAVRRLSYDELRVAQEIGPDPLPRGAILPLAPERSYIMTVVESERPFVSADLRCDPRVTPPGPLLARGVVSGLAVPVRGVESVIGVLALHARNHRRFSRDDVAAVSALAGVVATAWEHAAQREQLRHQALHDPLTRLPNRTLFIDRLENALVRRPASVESADPVGVAVMLIDLDDFKGINDSFGHSTGDHLLKVAADRLRGAVRPQDTIARLGGDEFVLLCDPISDEGAAVRLAQRMQRACSEPVNVTGASLSVSASFGITWSPVSPTRHRSAEALLDEADAALYRAKDRGRGQIEVFDDRLLRSTRRRRQVEVELRSALEHDEFRLHYQPVRRSRDLQVVGVEALLRWQHPSRGLLLPGEFVPVAEQSGLLVPLGRWALHTACRQAAQWKRDSSQLADPLWVAVNLSPRQLNDPLLPATVMAAQDEAGLDPGALVLELTESALMPGDATVRDALLELRGAGAQLFLDDFGTGYSSLTHLTQLPIQAVKIDKSFVAGLPTAQRDVAVVSALITLSDELGLKVIAEGVETAHQLEALRRMRCQSVQGFMFDLPGPDLQLPGPR
jgi:diguanylate cyclase (GGDEF)-like protein